MSIFGKMDAAKVNANPYFIEAGEYEAEVTKAEFSTNREGQNQLRITYTITDENSEFFDKTATQFFFLVDADMTLEQLAELPADDKKRINDNMSKLKRALCGNPANPRQTGLGVLADDLNDENWDPAVLVGTKVNLAINNFGDDNERSGVQWANVYTD